jgi:hypothetical protein
MSSQSNQAPELKRADTSEVPMTGEDRFAEVPARLHELLERGEISREAFAEYSATADAALSSSVDSSGHAHNAAPTRFVEVDGIRFAYRRFGNPIGTPIVLLQHFMGNLDNYDPAITDALTTGREVILTDNAGVGLSTGAAPETVAGMAATPPRSSTLSASSRSISSASRWGDMSPSRSPSIDPSSCAD